MSTDTPRTDAAITASGFQAVPLSFEEHSRTLERELARMDRLRFGADADRRLLRGELAKEREMVAMLENAVRYLANECDPKCNGFYNEFPDLRALIETENTP